MNRTTILLVGLLVTLMVYIRVVLGEALDEGVRILARILFAVLLLSIIFGFVALVMTLIAAGVSRLLSWQQARAGQRQRLALELEALQLDNLKRRHDAGTMVITAAEGEQIIIGRDTALMRDWLFEKAHLNPRVFSNGHLSIDKPEPHESATYLQRLTHRHPSKISPTANPKMLETVAVEPVSLPDYVDWLGLVGSRPTSIHKLVIGQAVNDEGVLAPMTAGLPNMVHVGLVASSGFGKSAALQALALQIALAKEPVEMVFIDAVEGVTSAPFEHFNRLRYPIATTIAAGEAALVALNEEMKRRQAAFAPLRVQKLDDYNAVSDTPLPYIVCLLEEVTAMMENNRQLHNMLAETVVQLRKTGIFLFMAGQEMTAKSIRPMIRRQISSRFVLHINDHWQAQGLGVGKEAVGLNKKGRAWAILPGENKQLIQFPYIEADLIERLLQMHGRLGTPLNDVPTVIAGKPSPAFTPKQQAVVDLFTQGVTDPREIARQVYQNDGGRQVVLVEQTLQKVEVAQ